jgi:hypothetical protein
MNRFQVLFVWVFAWALAVFAPFAHATDTVDVTGAVATINGLITPVGLVGAAVLSLVVIIKAWKWIRRAF